MKLLYANSLRSVTGILIAAPCIFLNAEGKCLLAMKGLLDRRLNVSCLHDKCAECKLWNESVMRLLSFVSSVAFIKCRFLLISCDSDNSMALLVGSKPIFRDGKPVL